MFTPRFKKAHPVFCKKCDKIDVWVTDNAVHLIVFVTLAVWIVNIISHRGM